MTLLPCPFCGSEAAQSTVADIRNSYQVHCSGRGCNIRPIVIVHSPDLGVENAKRAAITAWNTRNGVVPYKPEVTNALREILDLALSASGDTQSHRFYHRFKTEPPERFPAILAEWRAHLETLPKAEGHTWEILWKDNDAI